jgi:hypothetical protein
MPDEPSPIIEPKPRVVLLNGADLTALAARLAAFALDAMDAKGLTLAGDFGRASNLENARNAVKLFVGMAHGGIVAETDIRPWHRRPHNSS